MTRVYLVRRTTGSVVWTGGLVASFAVFNWTEQTEGDYWIHVFYYHFHHSIDSVSTWCCVRVCVVFILCTFYLFVQLWVWHFMCFDYLLFVLLVYSALSLLYGRNMRYINIIISTIIILLQNIGRLQPSEEGDATFCVVFFSLHKRIKNQLGWFVLVYSVFVFLISSSAKCNT